MRPDRKKAESRRARSIISLLKKEYPPFETELLYDEEWKLLVAVMLSAQTTDENVNRVTPRLFKKYRTPKAIGEAPIAELEETIYSTGYYRSKAKNLKEMCTELVERFDGVIPDTMEELTTLPGVGRKTANVVLHILHDKQEGIVFDTHIARVTHRLGFTERKDPVKGEQVMMELLPKNEWKRWGDLLIQHGREVCAARKPRCKDCVLNTLCPSAFQQ